MVTYKNVDIANWHAFFCSAPRPYIPKNLNFFIPNVEMVNWYIIQTSLKFSIISFDSGKPAQRKNLAILSKEITFITDEIRPKKLDQLSLNFLI